MCSLCGPLSLSCWPRCKAVTPPLWLLWAPPLNSLRQFLPDVKELAEKAPSRKLCWWYPTLFTCLLQLSTCKPKFPLYPTVMWQFHGKCLYCRTKAFRNDIEVCWLLQIMSYILKICSLDSWFPKTRESFLIITTLLNVLYLGDRQFLQSTEFRKSFKGVPDKIVRLLCLPSVVSSTPSPNLSGLTSQFPPFQLYLYSVFFLS